MVFICVFAAIRAVGFVLCGMCVCDIRMFMAQGHEGREGTREEEKEEDRREDQRRSRVKKTGSM